MALLLRKRRRLAAPPYRVGSDSTGSAGTVNSLTFAHTVPAGTELLALLIQGGRNSAVTISGATWNGAAMTERIDVLSTVSGERANVGIYWLASPAAAAGANIAVSFSANLDAIHARAICLAGVDLANPIAAYGSDTSNASRNSFAVGLTLSGPALVLGCGAISRSATSWTPGSGVTELDDGVQSGGGDLTYFSGEAAVDAAGSFSFAATAGASRAVAGAAIAFAGA